MIRPVFSCSSNSIESLARVDKTTPAARGFVRRTGNCACVEQMAMRRFAAFEFPRREDGYSKAWPSWPSAERTNIDDYVDT